MFLGRLLLDVALIGMMGYGTYLNYQRGDRMWTAIAAAFTLYNAVSLFQDFSILLG